MGPERKSSKNNNNNKTEKVRHKKKSTFVYVLDYNLELSFPCEETNERYRTFCPKYNVYLSLSLILTIFILFNHLETENYFTPSESDVQTHKRILVLVTDINEN